METPQIIVFALLAGLFVMLVWGRWRYDVTAFITLMAAVVFQVVPAGEAFKGFGHPATITVAAVLIISRALTNSGATEKLARLVDPAIGRTGTHIGLLGSLGAGMSGFMNNVGTLGILMPVAIQSALKAKRPAALILMPLSFATILGGLVTLIGTPPNIIIASYRGRIGDEPFHMFDFTPVGLITAVVGVLFISWIGWRLVPKPSGAADSADLFDIENYVTEVQVPKDCPHIGKTLAEVDEMTSDIDALVIDLIRDNRRYPGAMTHKQLHAGDILKIEAGPDDIGKFVSKLELEFTGAKNTNLEVPRNEDSTLIEAVITPNSRLEGRTIGSLRVFSSRGVTLMAVSRQGTPFRGRLKAFRLRAGDVLLLHGEAEHLPEAVSAAGCLPLAERALRFSQTGNAPYIIGIFAAAILISSLGLLPVPITLSIAVAVIVATGMLPLRELYEGVDWPVIVLLGSLIPVGGALETTGATALIADGILTATQGFSPVVVLVFIMVVTMTLSDVLNNAATAVVMAPIGVSVAARLDVNADPFLMAIAVAASCAFLTPIGHQNNALIMGPGGYRFGDYWRLGLPLEILVVAVSVPAILIFWPL